MLNINELEQRWLRYKIKSYIPHAIITLSTISIIIVTLMFMNKEDTNSLKTATITPKEVPSVAVVSPEKKVENTSTVTEVKKEIKELNTPALNMEISTNSLPQKAQGDKTKLVLSPSLDFMKKMQSNTLSNYENISQKIEAQKPIQKPVTQIVNSAKIKEVVQKETEPEEVEEDYKSSISIKRQDTHDDISQVVTRFNKNNNPALSLFIAKKYYELGNYHKSYNYALITNEINSDIEASWIVFAKSLVKLNEKELAIKTLKKYISQSNSNRANMLLDDITSGKFK